MPRSPAASSSCSRHRAVVVVERGVEAELQQPGHLLRGAGAADDAGGAHGLGDLAHQGADGAGGAGDEDDVAGLEVGDLEQAGVGGQAGHAQRAEESRRGGQIGAGRGGGAGVEHGVFTPAQGMHDGVAHLAVRGTGGDDLADGAAVERGVQGERRGVGLDVVHPAAHVGVHGDEEVADQDLAVLAVPAGRSRPGGSSPARGGRAGGMPAGFRGLLAGRAMVSVLALMRRPPGS